MGRRVILSTRLRQFILAHEETVYPFQNNILHFQHEFCNGSAFTQKLVKALPYDSGKRYKMFCT